jgi:hypothetical protein
MWHRRRIRSCSIMLPSAEHAGGAPREQPARARPARSLRSDVRSSSVPGSHGARSDSGRDMIRRGLARLEVRDHDGAVRVAGTAGARAARACLLATRTRSRHVSMLGPGLHWQCPPAAVPVHGPPSDARQGPGGERCGGTSTPGRNERRLPGPRIAPGARRLCPEPTIVRPAATPSEPDVPS